MEIVLKQSMAITPSPKKLLESIQGNQKDLQTLNLGLNLNLPNVGAITAERACPIVRH